jgi:hypothetical protein
MRTTITPENDAATLAQAHAPNSRQTRSESIRRGNGESISMRKKSGVWVFELPPGIPKVTSGQIKDLLEGPP